MSELVYHSYKPEQVTFLLNKYHGDLLSVLEKESRLRSGAYYGDMLSIEEKPEPEYTAIFDRILERNASKIAPYFLHLSEMINNARQNELTLVSLARAGTPVGVIITEILRNKFGREVNHYSVSAIHKYGVDSYAMKYLLEHHSPESLTFLDGWVSQGRITKTLVETLKDQPRIDPSLFCVSDPSGIQNAIATREDILLPSAILNATVSGLVSRTVNNNDGYHFAASYEDQADVDRSQVFVEKIVEEAMKLDKANIGELLDHTIQRPLAVKQINDWCEKYGTTSSNIKAGIGEVSRSLLRRDPRFVMIDENSVDQADHMFYLAEKRNIKLVVEKLDGPYKAFSILN